MFKRFLVYYKPHRKMLALDMIASLFISIIGMVYPVITRSMLNEYIPNKMYRSIPNGDYYFFVSKDWSVGLYGHPWRKELIVVGDLSWFKAENAPEGSADR